MCRKYRVRDQLKSSFHSYVNHFFSSIREVNSEVMKLICSGLKSQVENESDFTFTCTLLTAFLASRSEHLIRDSKHQIPVFDSKQNCEYHKTKAAFAFARAGVRAGQALNNFSFCSTSPPLLQSIEPSAENNSV